MALLFIKTHKTLSIPRGMPHPPPPPEFITARTERVKSQPELKTINVNPKWIRPATNELASTRPKQDCESDRSQIKSGCTTRCRWKIRVREPTEQIPSVLLEIRQIDFRRVLNRRNRFDKTRSINWDKLNAKQKEVTVCGLTNRCLHSAGFQTELKLNLYFYGPHRDFFFFFY